MSLDAAQKARKQFDELKPILAHIPSDLQIEKILAKYSDPLCDHCKEPLIGSSLDEVNLHYSKHGVTSGYIKCCEITLKTYDDIRGHVLTHLFPSNFMLVFLYKTKKFVPLHNLLNAIYACRCAVCGKTGKRCDKFKTHLSKHLIDIQKYPYMCTICEKGFARDDLLDVHMRYYHTNGNSIHIM